MNTFKKMDKSITPTWNEIVEGALVLYTNGHMESIHGHIRFFLKREDGTDEWTAGSSDDVTDIVDCWFKKLSRNENDAKKHEMHLNMQYYYEYVLANGYVTPQDWIEKYKHF
jgi:hypothetical protein